jgi:hypothetical protein
MFGARTNRENVTWIKVMLNIGVKLGFRVEQMEVSNTTTYNKFSIMLVNLLSELSRGLIQRKFMMRTGGWRGCFQFHRT